MCRLLATTLLPSLLPRTSNAATSAPQSAPWSGPGPRHSDKLGRKKTGKFAGLPSQEQAAQLAGVSERSVRSARVVLEHGTPELQEAVTRGRLAVHFAEKAARESPEAQAELLAAVDAGRTFQSWQNNHGRKKRATELATKTAAMPAGKRRWPVILVDPPWDFEIYAPDKQISHPAYHYPVMSLDEICTVPIAELAADDCVLFLWTTVPLCEKTFEVLRAWGFEYKSGLVWDKEIPGLGYWVRGQHELLLLATRGNPPLPATENVPASVIRDRRRDPPRKPEASYALIERMFPNLPKLELFARQTRAGWDVWGNETGKFAEVADPAPLSRTAGYASHGSGSEPAESSDASAWPLSQVRP